MTTGNPGDPARTGGSPGSVTAVETGARRVDPESRRRDHRDFRVRGEFARGATSADVRDAVAGRSPEGARSSPPGALWY
ncbi:MAG: hypothetical protein U5Q44_08620 [Dehalococcoidia bacterium]|nr:hypothetical protein [Dehalococcoidia bacterium]